MTEPTSAARALRERTAHSHRCVEQHLGVLDEPTPVRMLNALRMLHGFWSAGEPAIARWFGRHTDVAADLQWHRRARLGRITRDLVALGGAPAAAAPDLALFEDVDHAGVLGWLYVAEGSTLGGAVIDHALTRSGFPCRLESFTPYAEGPQPMWRAYLGHLERWTGGDPVRTELVVTAGERIFGSLERWVTPAAPEAVA